jgi:hypothetical protein
MGSGSSYSMMTSSMHTGMGWLFTAMMGLNNGYIHEYSHIQWITQRSEFDFSSMFASLTRSLIC